MKASVLTLGCRVNQAESAFFERRLSNLGIALVPLSDHPDYCIINTCSVTGKSDYQSRQLIRRALRSGARVLATGCYAELRAEEIKEIDSSIDVINNANKNNIINMIAYNSIGTALCWKGRSRPHVKIQNGCNSSCSYCIVPKARGRSRSAELPEIIRQVAELESEGYEEVVLTGIHLGSYGDDLNPKVKLSVIIETILKETTIHRLRLSSIEMNEIDGDIIDLLNEERVCPHLHVPLQSGDETVLRRMNRRYTPSDYRRKVELLAATVKGIAIGADVIVGFPGEGDAHFSNTKRLIDSLPLAYLHVFPFSPRPGTPAFKMDCQVPHAIKKQRCAELTALGLLRKKDYATRFIGRILDTVIEQKRPDQTAIGTTANYLRIEISPSHHQEKSHAHVRVTGMHENLLVGFPMEKL